MTGVLLRREETQTHTQGDAVWEQRQTRARSIYKPRDDKDGWPVADSAKESTCSCRRYKRHGFDPWVGKIPWRREWQSTPIFLPGKFHGQRSLMGCSPWSWKELDMTEWLTLSLFFFPLLFILAFFLFSLNSFSLHSLCLPSPLLFASLFYSLELSTVLRVQT